MNKLKIFVINLDSSTERMQAIDSQLSSLNLLYERIPAVNGKQLTELEISASYSKYLNKIKYRTNLSIGEIGCYLSHRLTWQKIVDNNLDFALILEDDAIINEELLILLNYIDKLKGYDLIKIAHTDDYKTIQKKALSNEFSLVNYKKIPNCMTGYLLAINGAKKLLSREKLYRPVDVDVQFFDELDISVVGIQPSVIYPNENFVSDIATLNGGQHRNKSNPWRNIKYRLSLFWRRTFYLSANLHD